MNTIETTKRDRTALVLELEKAGASFKGNACNCPYHNDNRPSAGIYQDDKGHWRFKCQACAVSGDVWDIQARNEGKEVVEVIKAVKDQSGTFSGKPEQQREIYSTIEDLKDACPGIVEAVYQYTDPTINKIDMVVIRCQTAEGKTFRQCRPCGVNGFEMKAPEKPWPLYNRGRVQAADTIVIVEGEKCVHALKKHGIVATTSPAGAGKAEHADWTPLAGKNVILWPDHDDPGHKHIAQVDSILRMLEPAPRISIIDPADLDLQKKEDAADYIEHLQAVRGDVCLALTEAFNRAKPKGIAATLAERIEDTISGKRQAVPWPQVSLSKLSKALIPGTVTLICGSPGASKSFWLLECVSYWLGQGIKACIYELEEDRDFHLMRALAQKAGIPGMTDSDWIKANPDTARAALTEHTDFLERMGRSIYAAPDTQITLKQLAQWADERAKAGYRIICIDPVTAAIQTDKPWIVENDFLQQIKRIATEHGCSFVLVTHPVKTVIKLDVNQLSGSAAYGRFAQCILWLQAVSRKSNVKASNKKTSSMTHNRIIRILKARNGRGQGISLACEFSKTLALKEYGIITKAEP